MTIAPAGPIRLYLEGGDYLGRIGRLELIAAIPAAASALASMSFEFAVVGDQAAKFLQAHFPDDLAVAVDAPASEERGRRNKSSRKRNPKWRLR